LLLKELIRLSPKTSRILSGSQTGKFIGFLHRRSHSDIIGHRFKG
jgi:hypothetical protein